MNILSNRQVSTFSYSCFIKVFNLSIYLYILGVGRVFESPKAYSIASEARRLVREGHSPCKYSQATQVIEGGRGNK